MRTLRSTLICFLVAPLITAFGADEALPQVPSAKPINVSDTGITRTSQFAVWKTILDTSSVIGSIRQGLFCTDPTKLYYKTDMHKWLTPTTQRLFGEESIKYGYPKYSPNDSAFDQKIGSDTDFKVGATMLDLQLDECGNDNRVEGSSYIKIKWELYSIQQQKVVYSKVIPASFNPQKSVSYEDFVDGLIRADIDNLLADPQYVAAFQTGKGNTDSNDKLAPMTITTTPVAPNKINVAKDSKAILFAVATIENGAISGSGFFINHDGYLLTNQHVVGGARYVKVKQADGHTQVGEVIRIHNTRDVALIKTAEPSPAVLNIRKTDASIGEEVYAVGSPYGEILAGTLTHGVLSQRRTIDGISYLQSDVSVKHGNSGGPLVDGNGNAIGITVSGLEEGGINMFIPIDDALDKLNITLQP